MMVGLCYNVVVPKVAIASPSSARESSRSSLRARASEVFSSGRKSHSSLGTLIFLPDKQHTFAAIIRGVNSSVERHRQKRIWREVWRALRPEWKLVGLVVWIARPTRVETTFQEKLQSFSQAMSKFR
jgi:ribonuclease P protein component